MLRRPPVRNVYRLQREEAIRYCDRQIALGIDVEANKARKANLQRLLAKGGQS